MSLARKHFERTRTEREAAGVAPVQGGVTGAALTSARMPQGDRMLITLRSHKAALKGIQSRKSKADAKREYLPEYEAYVDGVLAADNGGQDTVFVTVMLWRIDAGQYSGAMDLAAYAIRHGLAMPEGFNRDLATTVVEELADHALALDGGDHADLRDAIDFALDLVANTDMPDEVRAKGTKALGSLLQDTDPERAAELWTYALELDPKCGVKGQLERLRKSLNAAATTDTAGTSGT